MTKRCDFCRSKTKTDVQKYLFTEPSESTHLHKEEYREGQAKKKEKYKALNLEWICSDCLQAKKNKSKKARQKQKERRKNRSLASRVSQAEGEIGQVKEKVARCENKISQLEENKMVKRGQELAEFEEAEKIEKQKQEEKEKNTIHIKIFSLETKFHKIGWGLVAVLLIIALLVSWWKWKAIQEWLDKEVEEDEDEEL